MLAPSLYIRAKNQQGNWRYARVKEGRGVRTGDLKPPFYARPFFEGKQVWKTLSADNFTEAKQEAEQLAVALDAQARGLTVAEVESLSSANRIPIKTAIETYLEQKIGKAKKTVAQYRLTFNEFLEALRGKVRFLDEINENVLRSYKRHLVNKGHAGKTIGTRLNIVFFLLKKNGIKARIPRDEMPVVEKEIAVPYTDEEVKKLFAHMNEEERARYKFFLGTGCRDKEVTYAAWNDIDFDKKTYHVRRKEDVGFTPKSHESRTIPLPDSLVALLKERRKKASHERWIFVNEQGKPDNHFLRKLKRIA
ncbi:MAG: tyrosine-type recombinase/integrase, partial [Candidatus Acidiferrales bacterium]